jgi:hypothetical protein
MGAAMNQGNAQGGGDVLQVFGAEGRGVVHVELSGKPSFEKGLLEGIQLGVQGL